MSSSENPDVFDDEYEVEDELYVADGYRPQNHDREGGWRQDRYQDDEPVRSMAAHVATSSISPTPDAGPSRNSTRKSRGQQNPFTSPEDAEVEVPLVRTPSGNFAAARHSVSSTSSSRFARTSSQRIGAGPSHPYGLYTQGTLARTPSMATTSTSQPQRQSSSRRPQHPYALYTQGVGDDLDDEHGTAPNPVPVGFLGTGVNYQRRRGPDGEEQGLLGDFGHTEQLPPYTRYPEDGPEKATLLDVPIPPAPLHSHAPVLGTDPGMDLMHTQMQPVQQSMTDQAELNRQSSIMSRSSIAPSAEASSQDPLISRKAWNEKTWKEKRKTRVCGMPCWWFIVITGVGVFVAAMLGGVIGGFVQGQRQGQANALAQAAKTSLYDADIIVTYTTSPPPATGTYALPLGTPQSVDAACLTLPTQQPAWNCDLVGNVDIQIVIDTPPGSAQPGAYLELEQGNQPMFAYGSQRSQMQTQFSPFLLVTDNDDPNAGPAYYFNQQYNKIVIIHENDMNTTSGTIQPNYSNTTHSWYNSTQFAGKGDKPWFCFFNNTFVEGFIYPHERASIATPTSTSYPTPPPTTSAPPPPPATTQSTGSDSDAYSHSITTPWTIKGAAPTATVTTTIIMPATSVVYTGVASAFPAWMAAEYPGWFFQDGQANPPGQPAKRQYGYEAGYNGNPPVEQYPYVVKIEERRVPGSPRPYCNQIVVLDNWNWNWNYDANRNPITVQLDEVDPSYHEYVAAGEAGKRLSKRDEVAGECHCQWQSGQG